jgi:hypothetical protein
MGRRKTLRQAKTKFRIFVLTFLTGASFRQSLVFRPVKMHAGHETLNDHKDGRAELGKVEIAGVESRKIGGVELGKVGGVELGKVDGGVESSDEAAAPGAATGGWRGGDIKSSGAARSSVRVQSYVIKRDGRKEAVHFDKITSRIKKLCYELNGTTSA